MQDALKLKESSLSACHGNGYLLYEKEIESNITIMKTEKKSFFYQLNKKKSNFYLSLLFRGFLVKYVTYP